ncbi:MAG: Trp biosynthesis-associated membrane protein [Ornithinimicrobium sp.]
MPRWVGWLAVVGGALIALSGGRTWVRFTVQDPVLGESLRTASGYAASTALSAAGVLGLAAALTGLLTRRRVRMLALVVLSLDAMWALWLVVQVARDPTDSARQGVSEELQATTTGTVAISQASTTPWVWVFAAGAVLIAVGATWLALRAGRESGATPSSATDRDLGSGRQLPQTEVERRANTAAWNDLSRGNDPTTDD